MHADRKEALELLDVGQGLLQLDDLLLQRRLQLEDPFAARGDPLWLEIIETAARMLERTLRMAFRLPSGYGL